MKYLLIILLATFPQHKHKFTIQEGMCKCYTPLWCSVPKCKAMKIPFLSYEMNPYKIVYPGDSLYREYKVADTVHID